MVKAAFGERKGVMAAAGEPGQDKVACCWGGCGTAGFRGVQGAECCWLLRRLRCGKAVCYSCHLFRPTLYSLEGNTYKHCKWKK